MFDDIKSDKQLHGDIIGTKYITEPIILSLYRGVTDENELIENGGDYILDSNKFKDKAIWFSQNRRFAEGYADYALITYKLNAVKHGIKITYKDGYKKDDFHIFEEDYLDMFKAHFSHTEFGIKKGDKIGVDMLKDWPFYGGIELPGGWNFSYKVQKHIICSNPLILSKDMVEIMINEVEKRRSIIRSFIYTTIKKYLAE